MPFPTTGVLYAGTGANESPAAGFIDSIDGTSYGNVQRASNLIRSISGDAYPYWNAPDYVADQEVWVAGLIMPTSGTFDLLLRLNPVGSSGVDGYAVSMRFDSLLRFYRVDNNTYTIIGSSIASAWADGEGFGAAIVGTTIEAFRESGGTQTSMGTRTDSTYTGGGKIGLYIEQADMTFTDFGGGPVTVPPPTSARLLTLTGIGG